MLILAGVTIATLTGDNGLLQKATSAKQASENATIVEKARLAKLEYELEMRSNPNANQLNTMTKALRKVFNDDTMEVKQAGNGFTFTTNGKKYIIKSDGTLKEMLKTTGLVGKLESDGTLKIKATSQSGDGYTDIYNGEIKNMYTGSTKILKVEILELIAPQKISFYQCSDLSLIKNIENMHTENMTTMLEMFRDCSNLTKVDVSGFETSNVLSTKSMFKGCGQLTELNLNNFDMSNVTDMSYMFSGCNKLQELNISNFNLISCTTTSDMFVNCNKLNKLDLSTWINTSGVGNMNYMFQLTGSNELAEVNFGKNFIIGTNTTYNNFMKNVKNTTHIICNSDMAEKIGNSFTNVTIIQ